MSTDRIVKTVLLNAPRERVWRAISDSAEFGQWFGVRFEGPFVAGRTLEGRIVPTTVDPDIAAQQKPHEGMVFQIVVESVVPMQRLAFRWHPYAVEPADYSKEPMTLVTFELSDAPGGILLTIVESGFDLVALERRAKAFEANEGGWQAQTRLIQKYLAAQKGA